MQPASLKAGSKIEDSEHFHSIFRHGILLVDNGNLAVTQGVGAKASTTAA